MLGRAARCRHRQSHGGGYSQTIPAGCRCNLAEHSLCALLACGQIAGIVVALHPEDTRARPVSVFQDARVHTVVGAEARSGSVLAGLDALCAVAAPQDWVLVHDAARPCLQASDIARLIDAVVAANTGGILAEPIVDTVKASPDARAWCARWTGRRCGGRRRRKCFASMNCAWRCAGRRSRGLAVTDEASAMELAGYPVQLIVGPPGNLKVTVPADLPLADW